MELNFRSTRRIGRMKKGEGKGKKIGRKEGRNKHKEGKQIKRRRNKSKSSKLSSPSARTRV